MVGDNWIFDVNGSKKEDLKAILSLALFLSGHKEIVAYKIDKKRGIILYWYFDEQYPDKEVVKFPLQDEGLILETLWAFLQKTQWEVTFERWEDDLDHDGHNSLGFRVKTGDWGKIDEHRQFLLVKPVYIWYGK